MLAADILEVPVSRKNHHYLLVVMDYFTKWVEAVPLQNQTAATVTQAIIKICSTFAIPSILHLDQGTIFDSHMLQQMLQAFGRQKSCTTAYHPQCGGMVNRSLLQMLRYQFRRGLGDLSTIGVVYILYCFPCNDRCVSLPDDVWQRSKTCCFSINEFIRLQLLLNLSPGKASKTSRVSGHKFYRCCTQAEESV